MTAGNGVGPRMYKVFVFARATRERVMNGGIINRRGISAIRRSPVEKNFEHEPNGA